MDRVTQTRIVSQLFAHMAARTTDLAPATMRHPARAYVDPAEARRERETVFARHPLVLGHSSELAAENDFLTADLAGVPALAVRQTDGTVRAFVNLCRHRGAKLESAERGNRRQFSCPFHAWTYDAAGGLRTISYPKGFDGVDRAERGLVELPVEERHGLLWVVPRAGARLDVAAHLGPALDAELAGWGIEGCVFERIQHFDLPINWKLLVDGFMEDYHLTVLHKATVGPYFAANLHTFEAFGPSSRLVAARAGIADLASRPPHEVDLLRCSVIIYALFPSSLLVWQNDHFELWTLSPDQHDACRTRVAARLLAPSAEDALRHKELWDKNWRILMGTVEREDWVSAKAIQDGIFAGGAADFVFGRNEPALQHFHRQIGEAVARRDGGHRLAGARG